MKSKLPFHSLKCCLVVAAFGLLWQQPLVLAQSTEADAIAILNSDQAPREKDAACAILKRNATVHSVPALAKLLTDDQLSHSACYVLETLPGPEAAQALIQALEKTTGLTRIGIINTIGWRRDQASTPEFNSRLEQTATASLIPLLTNSDPQTVTAAARALGKVAGLDITHALENTLKSTTPATHEAIAEAYLVQAGKWQAKGDPQTAFSLFERLYKAEKLDYIRVSAYRGMILSSGDKAPSLITDAISGTQSPAQMAALQLVPFFKVPGLATLLPKLQPEAQISLINVLGQGSYTDAAPAIAAFAASTNADIRQAVFKTLGLIGGSSEIPVLLQAATSTNAIEQKIARQSLLTIRNGTPANALMAALPTAQPAVQSEISRALGQRGDPSVMPKLFECAKNGTDSTRLASLEALALLADSAQLPGLVDLVTHSTNASVRAEALEALNTTCQRIYARHRKVNADAILNGMKESPDALINLLPVCSSLVDPQIREMLKTGMTNSNALLRSAAVRTLCETHDPELLPDLVKVASTAPEPDLRTLAVRSCVRLTTQDELVHLQIVQKIESFKTILGSAPTVEHKQIVLSGLGEIPDAKSLEIIIPLLNDSSVKAEAAAAAIKVSSAIHGTNSKLAAAALKQAIPLTTPPALREQAETTLKKIDEMASYLTAWQISGPYQAEGKKFDVLFDTVFPPEGTNASTVQWQVIPPATTPQRPWLMDILKFFGGEQRVAYVRTWIHSGADQPALLNLGSDDGMKVWFNGKLLHSNNASRALAPDSDKVPVTLNKGWNSLMLKITQNNAGWEFCGRCVKPDGSILPNIEISAVPPSK